MKTADRLCSPNRRESLYQYSVYSYCGYQAGVFTTDNYLGLREASIQMYGVPGKLVAVRSTRGNQVLAAFFLFKQPAKLRYDYHDVTQHKQLLAEAFAGEGWEVPRLLEKMHTAPDLYFDAVSQIRMDAGTTDERCCWEMLAIARHW